MNKHRYTLTIEPAAHAERQRLPGHVRQRVKQTISDLASQPRPHNSEAMDITDLGVPDNVDCIASALINGD